MHQCSHNKIGDMNYDIIFSFHHGFIGDFFAKASIARQIYVYGNFFGSLLKHRGLKMTVVSEISSIAPFTKDLIRYNPVEA